MKYQKIPALSGFDPIRILKKEGWAEHRQTNHGVALVKKEGERMKVTIIPKSKASFLSRANIMRYLPILSLKMFFAFSPLSFLTSPSEGSLSMASIIFPAVFLLSP